MSQFQHSPATTQHMPADSAPNDSARRPNLWGAKLWSAAAAMKLGRDTQQAPVHSIQHIANHQLATHAPVKPPQPPQFTDAFKTQSEVGNFIKRFDFTRMDLWSHSREDSLIIGLVPAYGTLNSQSIKTLDDETKIMIAVTTNILAKIPPNTRTWDSVRAAMMQNPVTESFDALAYDLKPIGRTTNTHARTLDPFTSQVIHLPVGLEASLPEYSTDPTFLDQIAYWIKDFPDRDALLETRIDYAVLGSIVARAEESVNPEVHCGGTEYMCRKPVIDITVLRHPDMDHPYFKLYCISLTGLMYTNGSTIKSYGTTATYNRQCFKPSTAVISRLPEKTRREAVRAAEALFEPKSTNPIPAPM